MAVRVSAPDKDAVLLNQAETWGSFAGTREYAVPGMATEDS